MPQAAAEQLSTMVPSSSIVSNSATADAMDFEIAFFGIAVVLAWREAFGEKDDAASGS